MNFHAEDWLGDWVNFESMIESSQPALDKTWQETEEMVRSVPPLAKMFGGSAKDFWKKTCSTITSENTVCLAGCHVEKAEEGIMMTWYAAGQKNLGQYRYTVQSVLAKGLEGKDNYIFFAPDAPDNWPFRYVIAMEPLPERSALANGGLMSHIHFQFASRLDALTDGSHLVRPMWYPTLCDGAGSLLDQCNVVRAMHKLPAWEKLPD